MKKENSLFAAILKDLATYAVEIIIVTCALAGGIFAVSWIAEFLSGIVDLGTGFFILFTVAGLTLYIDFRPGKEHSGRRAKDRKRAVRSASCRLVRAYPTKQAG